MASRSPSRLDQIALNFKAKKDDTMYTEDMTNPKKEQWPYPRYKDYQRGLRDAASAWFAGKKAPVQKNCSYILEGKKSWKNNIILDEVYKYIIDHDVRPLHSWIHHGLSSQAMLFNLVGPLMARHETRHDLSPLDKAFQDAGIPWPSEKVEHKLEEENRDVFDEFDNPQPTSIDLLIRGTGDTHGKPLFIEAKLSESEFGGCSPFGDGNCDGRNPARTKEYCYYHCIGRTYWIQMEKHGLLTSKLRDCPFCPFISHFQFFRELLFALHNDGHFVLLYDERNPTFVGDGRGGERGLFPLLVSLLPSEAQQRVHGITIQRVFSSLARDSEQQDWIEEFRSKYGLDEL